MLVGTTTTDVLIVTVVSEAEVENTVEIDVDVDVLNEVAVPIWRKLEQNGFAPIKFKASTTALTT